MTMSNCPGCMNENSYCIEHQKHEKAVYESIRFAGKHDTAEFRMAIHDARLKDMREH